MLTLRNRKTVLVVNNVSPHTAAIFNCYESRRSGHSLLGWSLTLLISMRHSHLVSLQFLMALSSGYKKGAVWKKNYIFTLGVNVWQLSKYNNYDYGLNRGS